MRNYGKLVWTALIVVMFTSAASFAAETAGVTFDGILGQTADCSKLPYQFTTAHGVAIDKQNRMLVVSLYHAYVLKNDNGAWRCVDAFNMPVFINNARTIYFDGDSIFMAASDSRIHRISIDDRKTTAICAIPKKFKDMCVAPAGLSKGFAGNAKFFVLLGTKVLGYTADGKDAGIVLSPPPLSKGNYCCVGIDPVNGDLLLGSYYPDMKIYRFKVNGKMVSDGDWPRSNRFAKHISYVGDKVFTLRNGAKLLPTRKSRNVHPLMVGPYWTNPTSSIARDASGGYWLATTQGVCAFTPTGKPLKIRIGGIDKPSCPAVASDGTLIVVSNKERLIRLNVGDDPNTAFECDGNEPFRIGGGWSGKTSGVAFADGAFLVLDTAKRKLWRFDPRKLSERKGVWESVSKPNAFEKPLAITSNDENFWILDGKKVLAGKNGNPAAWRELHLPKRIRGIQKIAAFGENGIAVSYDNTLALLSANSANPKIKWSNKLEEPIAAMAGNDEFLVVVARNSRLLSVFSPSGKKLCDFDLKGIPGGIRVTGAAVFDDYAYLTDAKGSRIVRLKISKTLLSGRH